MTELIQGRPQAAAGPNVIRLMKLPSKPASPREQDRDVAFYSASTDLPVEDIQRSVQSGMQSTLEAYAGSSAQTTLTDQVTQGLDQEDFDERIINTLDEMREVEFLRRHIPHSMSAAIRANITGSRELALDRISRAVILNDRISARSEAMSGVGNMVLDFAEILVDPLDILHQRTYVELTERLEDAMNSTVSIEEYSAEVDAILSEAADAGFFSEENSFYFGSFLDTFSFGPESSQQAFAELLGWADLALTGTLDVAPLAVGIARRGRAAASLAGTTALTTGVVPRGVVGSLRDAARDSVATIGLMKPSERTQAAIEETLARAINIDDPGLSSTIVPAHTHSSLATPTLIRGGFLSSASSSFIRKFEQNSETLRFLREISVTSGEIFDEDTLRAFASEFAQGRREHLARDSRVIDVEVGQDDFHNLFYLDVLGTIRGTPFRSERAARNASQFGEEVVFVGDGQWVNIRRNNVSPENLEWLKAEGYTADLTGLDLYRRTDPDNLGDGFSARHGSPLAQADPATSSNLFMMESSFNRAMHEIHAQTLRIQKSMSRRQISEVYAVFEEMANQEGLSAFSRSGFESWFVGQYRREPTPAQTAYYLLEQERLDAQLFITANTFYRNAVDMNARILRIGEQDFTVRPVSVGAIPEEALVNVDGTLTPVSRIPEGQTIFQNIGDVDFPGNVQFFTTVSPEARAVRHSDFMPRNSGGHVSYLLNEMQFIAKQPNTRIFVDGTERELAPRTLFAARTRDEIDTGIREVNTIIDALEDALGRFDMRMTSDEFLDLLERSNLGPRLDDVVSENSTWNRGVSSLDDFIAVARSRGIDLRRRFSAVAEGDAFIKDFAKLSDSPFLIRGGTHADDVRLNTMRSGRGSQRLLRYGGETVTTLSPQRSIQGSITASVASSTETAYRTRAGTGLIKAALHEGVMKPDYNLIRHLPLRTQLEEISRRGLIDTSGAAGRRQNIGPKLKLDLDRLMFRLQQDSYISRKWRAFSRSIANFMYGKGFTYGTNLFDRWSSDPLSALRGLAFDAYLGMWNPSQLLMQSAQFVNIFAVSPRNAMKAAALYGPMRFLLNNAHAPVRSRVASLLKPLTGLEDEDFEIMMEMFRRSGRGIVTNNLAELTAAEDVMSRGGVGPIRDAVSGARESGRFFFKEGDLLARITGFTTAYLNYIEKAGRRPSSWQDAAARSWITWEEQRLTQAMTSVSRQAYEQAPFMQFMTYQLRVYEALFAGTFSNTKSVLTAAEKARFMGTHFALWGAAATIPTTLLTQYLEANTDAPVDQGAAGLMARGLVDTILSEISGSDTAARQRFSSSGAFFQLMQTFAEENPLVALGGPSVEFGSNLIDGTISTLYSGLVGIATGEFDPARTDLKDLVRLTSTGNYAYNAVTAYLYGSYYARNGQRVSGDLEGADWFFTAFGVPLEEVSSVYNYMAQRKFMNKYLDWYAGNVTQNWSRVHRAMETGDTDRQDYYLNQISLQMNALEPWMAERVDQAVRDSSLPLSDQFLTEMLSRDVTSARLVR